MSLLAHRMFIGTMVLITVLTTCYLSYVGYDYYRTPIEMRFDHPNHAWFKPSGPYRHGLGIIGTLCILIGVVIYIVRKRSTSLARLGRLKHWLEFHIFLCTVGPIMVLFHTSFKFGGIVSIAFWSMVLVVASGVLGRFIYLQIPRSIEGRELSLQEVQTNRLDIQHVLLSRYQLDESTFQTILQVLDTQNAPKQAGLLTVLIAEPLQQRAILTKVKSLLRSTKIAQSDVQKILGMIGAELRLNKKIERLQTMQKLFRYWHVAHLPFAIIMLVIVVIHVAVTLLFGYKWIF